MTEGAPLLQGLLSLAAVAALLWVAARFARRFAPAGAGTASPLKPIATLAVGTRERIVVVEAGDQWLVVGVCPGNMRTLHVMPKGELPAVQSAPFADAIASALKRVKTPMHADTRR